MTPPTIPKIIQVFDGADSSVIGASSVLAGVFASTLAGPPDSAAFDSAPCAPAFSADPGWFAAAAAAASAWADLLFASLAFAASADAADAAFASAFVASLSCLLILAVAFAAAVAVAFFAAS